MRQILYISSSTRGMTVDVGKILEQSRHNNALDGITGLLWSDSVRFLQVLEGPEDSVAEAFERISRDPRHHAIVVLSDKTIETRQFGDWAMGDQRRGEADDAYSVRLLRMLDGASEDVRQTFLGLIATRTAAANARTIDRAGYPAKTTAPAR